MRREHFERLRRRGAAMSWAAATEDLPAYDAAFPWEWVFAAAVTDRDYWQSEVHGPVLLATSQGFATAPQVETASTASGSQQPPRPAPLARKRTRPNSSERMHHLDNEGMFISNRAGSVLCRDYNK
eukprot:5164261-Amphidinium_carterae.1